MTGDKSFTGKMLYSTILVTGCGGDIGLGIGRILKMSGICEKVIGCDIHDEHPGTYIFDNCEVIQRANSDDFLKTLGEILAKHSVDLVIPTSEPELRALFMKNLLDFINNVPLVLANKKALAIGFDKLKTADFLKSIGLLYPWTKIVKEGFPEQFPCIIKSRYGAGSKGVVMVDEELSKYYAKKRHEDIYQEYLHPSNQEYTCGVYRSKKGEIRTLIIKRQLQNGITVYGKVVNNSEVKRTLVKLAEAMELSGSINVQLILTDRGPIIFEINPRFSSTVVFRHLLGFEDLIWSLIEKKGAPLGQYKPILAGTKLYRLSHEVISVAKES